MAPTPLQKTFLVLLFILAISFSTRLSAQVSITSIGVLYAEDFNTLASTGSSSTLPTGWALSETLTNANATYTAGTGSLNTGDTWSYGAANNSERAFGGLRSSNLLPTIGVGFINNTGALISTLAIAYRGEQWRLGTISRVDRLDFQYSTDATSLSTGTWTDVNTLDFTAPNTGPTTGALNGNSSLNSTFINALITGLTISDGSTFWLRWNDLDATGADDGLAVDSFRMKACVNLCGALPLNWLSFSAQRSGERDAKLNWATTEEYNNAYFVIQRSINNGLSFQDVDKIAAATKPGSVNAYEYMDRNASVGRTLYRIMQMDNDGYSTYSPISGVTFTDKYLTVRSWPNPATDEINIDILAAAGPGKITIFDLTGRLVLTANFDGTEAREKIELADLDPGIYSLLVEDGVSRHVEKIVVAR